MLNNKTSSSLSSSTSSHTHSHHHPLNSPPLIIIGPPDSPPNRLKVKQYSSPKQIISQLWDITCHMGSQCYLPPVTTSQVNTPRLNPSQRLLLDLPTAEGWKAELT